MNPYVHPEVLVTTEWAASNTNNPKVRIVEVDVDTKAYDEGHLPNALGWAWNTQLCDTDQRDSAQNDPLDLAGDLAVQLGIVWAVAVRVGTSTAFVLALVASAGIVLAAAVSYRKVFRRVWAAQARGERHDVPKDNYGSRFARRNGPVYALLVTALVGRLDLFLWAAAIGSHLFYLGWLRTKERASR